MAGAITAVRIPVKVDGRAEIRDSGELARWQ